MKQVIEELQQRWLNLFPGSAEAEKVYQELVKMYTQKHRAYHTLDHVAACLGHLDGIKDKVESPLAIELAIWFHDCIYNIFSRQNEEKSALYAVETLADLNVDEETIVKVNGLIMTTIHPASPENGDEYYMADIDITILGSSPEAYRDYEKQIRYEYKWIPRFMYNKQRSLLLQSFLKQEHIYITEYFHDRFEAQARENIAAAIDMLNR